jgi:predicted MFS family arabinose efflux permease
LTLLGALSSPIFYPLAAWLIEELGWRAALRVLVMVSAACVLPSAVFIQSRPAQRAETRLAAGRGLVAALKEPVVRQALIVFGLAAFANSALLLHQVSVMQAAGLSLAAASGFAGARGFFQIPGRLALSPLTRRLGVRGTMALCYAFAATAGLALMLSLAGEATWLLAGYFAVVGGASLGLLSPLNGLFQAEIFGDERLGTLSGVNVLVVSIAGAAGAWSAGLAVDLTGTYTLPLAIAALIQAIAIIQLRRGEVPSGGGAVVSRAAGVLE